MSVESDHGGFVGRRGPLRQIERAITSGGGAELVLLTGEPGIGKTRLLDEASRLAREADFCVARGRCAEVPGTPDYRPVAQVLTALSRAFPDATSAIPEDSPLLELLGARRAVGITDSPMRFRLLADAAEWIGTLCEERAVCILLDDLHVADRASAQLLAFLAAELESARLVVIASARDVELSDHPTLGDDLGRFLERARSIPLSPLDRGEVARMASFCAGEEVGEALGDALFMRSAGNPLFVRQLVEWLLGDGDDINRPGLRAELDRVAPRGVHQVMGARLRALDESQREALGLAAVLGREFPRDLLNIVAKEQGIDDPLPALDRLASRGLIRESEDDPATLVFSHVLIRDAFYEELTPARRRALHASVCDAILTHRNIDLDTWLSAAAHHAQAGLHPSLLDLVVRAGDRALERFAHDRAAEWFRQALAIAGSVGSSDRHRARLEERLGTALWQSGDADQAREHFRQSMMISREVGDARAFAAAAIGFAGRTDRATAPETGARAFLEEALERLGPDDEAERAEVSFRLASSLYFDEDASMREEVARSAVHSARRVGDPRLLSYALNSRHFVSWRPGRLEERLPIGREQLECALLAPHSDAPAFAHFNCAKDAFEAGDANAVDRHIQALGEEAERLKLPFFAFQHAGLSATRLLTLGRVDEAEALGPRLLALGQLAGSPNAPHAFGALLCGVRRAQGRMQELEPILSETIRQAPQLTATRFLLAESMLAAGRDAEAASMVSGALAALMREQPLDFNWSSCLSSAARLAFALGDEAWAEELLPSFAGTGGACVVSGFGNGWDGAWDYHRGRLCVLLGRDEEARLALEASAELHAGFGATPYLAHSWLALAQLEQGRGERAAAQRFAKDATEIYRTLGLEADIASAGRLIDELGGPPSVEADSRATGRVSARPRGRFLREGDVWRIEYGEETVQLRDAKGLRDLATLLAQPNEAVPVMELYREAGPETSGTATPGDDDTLLDARARRDYADRIRALQQEREDAEARADLGAIERCREELDFLETALSRATGLGGRSRRTSAPSERARKAVSNRIRTSIRRIAKAAPELGAHLEQSIRTGSSCGYRPIVEVDWEL